jgi:3-dehydro-L-gulonate 2-dehydrogenase
MTKLTYPEIQSELERILKKIGFAVDKAFLLSKIFSDNNLLGKESHGLNRFPGFIGAVKRKSVLLDSDPELVSSFQALEQWDGNQGAGPLNAMFSVERACKLADKYGIGCVALRNTNHWMRGGSYGWRAAELGYISFCWTNAKPTMPPWGSTEIKLGNNPLVISVPYNPDPIVFDAALTQYSYGTLEVLNRKGGKLKYDGGFDKKGNLTKDPGEILETQRALPIGLWKGSGLSLMLDILASLMSGGKSAFQIKQQGTESKASQVFIAVKPGTVSDPSWIENMIDQIVDDFHQSLPEDGKHIFYPGEQSSINKAENLKLGIQVESELWEQIKAM